MSEDSLIWCKYYFFVILRISENDSLHFWAESSFGWGYSICIYDIEICDSVVILEILYHFRFFFCRLLLFLKHFEGPVLAELVTDDQYNIKDNHAYNRYDYWDGQWCSMRPITLRVRGAIRITRIRICTAKLTVGTPDCIINVFHFIF